MKAHRKGKACIVAAATTTIAIFFVIHQSTGGIQVHLQSEIVDSSSLQNATDARREIRSKWSQIDVLLVSKSVNCLVEMVAESLVANLGVRRIWLISPADQCSCLKPTSYIQCIAEDIAVPGISLETLKGGMSQLESAGVCHPQLQGVHPSNLSYYADKPLAWYLQQFLKLTVPIAVSNISDYVLIWDADMVLLDAFEPFVPGTEQVVLPFRNESAYPQYRDTFRLLMNFSKVAWDQDTNYVLHHMLMYKPYIAEMLHHFARWGTDSDLINPSGTELPGWSLQVLAAACLVNPGRSRGHGLSEYAWYASFVQTMHPETVLSIPAWKHKRDHIRYGHRDLHVDLKCTTFEKFRSEVQASLHGISGAAIFGLETHASTRESSGKADCAIN